jgi:pimeloyl-ACP methyl ester carboxylesterase
MISLRQRPRLRRILRLLGLGLALVVVATAVLCSIPHRPTLAGIRPRESTRYWRMRDGHRIAYTRVAAPAGAAGAPIVFLHGGPGGYVYRSTIETMGRFAPLGHDVYLYDQIGSGLSDRLARPKDYSVARHLADLHEIVSRHLGGRRVILVGQSYGGLLAAYYLARHADLVERAVLASPGDLQPTVFDDEGEWVNERKYPVPPELHFRAARQPEGDTLFALPLRGIASAVAATAFNRKLAPDAEADGMLNDFAVGYTAAVVCDPRHVKPEEGGLGFYAHIWSNFYPDDLDVREALRKVATPVLVLQGECDFIDYAGAYEYADLLPHGDYRFVPGAGHEIWWDQPESFVRLVGDFLR